MLFDVSDIISHEKELLRKELVEIKSKYNKTPSLAIISASDDYASSKYVNNKIKTGTELGFDVKLYKFPGDGTVTTKSVQEFIQDCDCSMANGVIVQLPVDPYFEPKDRLINQINWYQDVDCFSDFAIKHLFYYGTNSNILPCTPRAVLKIIDKFIPNTNRNKYEGKRITILSRSDLIGKPLSLMLMQKGATVTVCNSKTKDTWAICNQSDIVVSAMGKTGIIDPRYFKVDSLWVDVSINRNSDGKVCGDVSKEYYDNKYCYITPVPGSVGPLTVLSLFKNVLECFRIQQALGFV